MLDSITNTDIKKEYKKIKAVPEKDKKKVSIILPIKDEGTLVQTTVLSILHNTDYPNFEILLCDQGSIDGCCDFIKWENFKNYQNIKYIDCKNSSGVCETRNTGARQASGEYIVYFDAHMAVEPGWVDKFILGYINFDKVGLVGANIPDLYSWGTKGSKYVYNIQGLNIQSGHAFVRDSDLIDNIYVESPNTPSGAMFMTKEFFEYSGGFDEGMLCWGFEDLELSLRTWLLGYKCINVTNLHIYHYYKQSTTYTKKPTDYEYNKLRLIFTNFQTPEYQAKIINKIKNTADFATVLAKINQDKEYKKYQKEQQSRFVHNDKWWYEKFKHYLDNFLD